jgi:hypothetical protein
MPAPVFQLDRLDLGLVGRSGSGRGRGGPGSQQGGDPLDRGRIGQLNRNVALRAGDPERVQGAGREAVELTHDRATRIRLRLQRSQSRSAESRGDRGNLGSQSFPCGTASRPGSRSHTARDERAIPGHACRRCRCGTSMT